MITINGSWFLCFISFFFQKVKNNILKKASQPKFFNIIFLFLIKIVWIKPVGQQINLISPNGIKNKTLFLVKGKHTIRPTKVI